MNKSDRIILSRAPVRICDIGGWSDTWFSKKGAVFNFCVDLYSYIRIRQKNQGEKRIQIMSENLDLTTEIQEYRKIEYDGILDLLKAAIKKMEIEQGLDIFARSDAPPGCGTGTSASIAVALIGALSLLKGQYYVPHEVAELAHSLETDELGLESGVQDQYAAAFGGFNYMDIDYPRVKISRIDVKPEISWQLEQQMILVYLGSRSSSKMHEAVINNYQNGERGTLDAFDELRKYPKKIVQALRKGDMEAFGTIMNENWRVQKDLHELMVNPAIERLEKLASKEKALGFKVNGAGGGGSAVILSRLENVYSLKKEITKDGFTILPCKIDYSGMKVWHYPIS
ncbi:MAG: GHMP family kinase ATP-binding protein [Promethearchaeota archaeon]